MRVLIFDLDFTLADTGECLPYLTSIQGREDVIGAIDDDEVAVEPYYRGLIESFNGSFEDDLCAVVVSDSPTDYCIKVLKVCGYKIDSRFVFGNQKKPLVNFESLTATLAEELDVDEDDLSFLVIGDSPKDIYFAHHIQAPSIFARWGSRHEWASARKSKPTKIVDNFEELKVQVRMFLRGKLVYVPYDFYENFDVFSIDELNCVELDEGSIGNVREYVPHHENNRDDRDSRSSQDLRWIIKPAKNYSAGHHRRNQPMQFYGSAGVFPTRPLKSLAGIYKYDFKSWLESKGVRGKVLLVPVPPSVPHECNLSNPMALIAEWWSDWLSADMRRTEIQVFDVFRRVVPRHPSHDGAGPRSMDDQFPTLGVIPEAKFEGHVDYVIILDDVITSGSHMNAIASIINSTDLVNDDAEILGYALFKTVHTEKDAVRKFLLSFGGSK